MGPKHQLWKTEDRHGNFTPWAYGANAAGQLGDGRSTVDCWVGMPGSPCHGVEVAVPGKKRDMEFVAGHYDDPHDGYSLALLYNDRVWAWGSNRYGTLGIGTVDSDPHPTPQIVPGIGGIQFISGGYRHVLASDFMCTWGWGDNSNNQLGLGSGAAAVITIPTLISVGIPCSGASRNAAISASTDSTPKVSAVAAGDGFSVFLLDDGSVWTVGRNDQGQLGDGTGVEQAVPVKVANLTHVTAIAAGKDHVLGLQRNGHLWSWGGNAAGQLGDGTANSRFVPVRVQAASGGNLSGVLSISAGAGYSAALVNGGTVWAWGENSQGQLGNGTTDPANRATRVPGLVGVKGVKAGSGGSVVAVKGNGWPMVWGDNSYGQLHDGTTRDRHRPKPLQVAAETMGPLTGVLSTSLNHTLVLQTYGRALAWGRNLYGQLGNGTTDPSDLAVPVVFAGSLTELAAGLEHSLAVDTQGAVWGWGQNASCQIGHSADSSPHPLPWRIDDLPGVSAVSPSLATSLALDTDGNVWGWGYNGDGQLGTGGISDKECTPVQAVGLPGAKAVAASGLWSMALGVDGSVYGWGDNRYGQLGNGTNVASLTPVPAQGLDSVKGMAAGWGFALALKSDGTVWSWGNNDYGQLGHAWPGATYAPMQVVTIDDGLAIAAGNYHSLALRSDGTVWAWGANYSWQLGDGTTTQRNTPVQVPGLSNVVAIAAGYEKSVAIDGSGGLWEWGDDTPVPTPVQSAAGVLALLRPAPVADPPTAVTVEGFTANWRALAGATTYFLDVASDPDFAQFVTGYEFTDVGNVLERRVTGINPKANYYYRVSAAVGGLRSAPSNTVTRFGTNHPPTVGTLAPATVTSAAGRVKNFTAVYEDPDGAGDLSAVDLLVSPDGGTAGILVRYDQGANQLMLFNNRGTAPMTGRCAPGDATTLINRWGKLNCHGTTVTVDGNQLTVQWKLVPRAAFANASVPKQVKLRATDKDSVSSHWQLKGNWTVTP